MTILAIFLLTALHYVKAVTVGHEQYGNIPGYFYVFSNKSISIVDPMTGTVNKTIPSKVTSYSDSVYMQDQAQLRHYVYVAERLNNAVTVMDADTQTVLTSVAVGLTPVHIYALFYNDEVRFLIIHCH